MFDSNSTATGEFAYRTFLRKQLSNDLLFQEGSSSKPSVHTQVFNVTAIQDPYLADIMLQYQSISCQPEYLDMSPEVMIDIRTKIFQAFP
jgi:hypothetical protein